MLYGYRQLPEFKIVNLEIIMVIHARKVLKDYGINEFLLSLYISFILSTVYCLEICNYLSTRLFILSLIIVWVFIFLIISFLSPFILSVGNHLSVNKVMLKTWSVGKGKWFILSFFTSVFLLLPSYVIYYPGWFSADSLSQLSQASSGNYSDWHPVLQTLIAFTLPLKLTHGWTGSVILFQIVEYSFVLAYLSTSFYKHGCPKYAIISLLFILLNPFTVSIIKQPWKDVTFAIFGLLLITCVMNAYYDKDWINKPIHQILLITVFCVATIVRHNAILFTLPLAIEILLLSGKKQKTIFLLGSAALFLFIKYPFYSFLNVSRAGSRNIELLGVPMNIIANVVKNDPSSLNDEILSFAYSLASPQEWNEYYYTGDFNILKFTDFFNPNPINLIPASQIIKYAIICLISSPKYALQGLLALTSMVYAISGPITWTPEFFPNAAYFLVSNSIIKYFCLYIGLPTLVVIILTLSKCRLSKLSDWKTILFCISLLTHNWGTMLLLTGPDFRFFYLTFPISTVIVFVMLNQATE